MRKIWITSEWPSGHAQNRNYCQATCIGSELEQVHSYKYLGVLLTSDLSWSPHVTNICTKARKVLGLLYRRFYGSTSQDSLKQLYLSLVRPHLEYACQVWDPHLAGDNKAIESVQKFALKLATAKWDKSYNELLDLAELKLSRTDVLSSSWDCFTRFWMTCASFQMDHGNFATIGQVELLTPSNLLFNLLTLTPIFILFFPTLPPPGTH